MKILIVILTYSVYSFAIKVNLAQVACNLTELTAEECASLLDDARERILENLPDVSLEDYADGIADATGFALQGQGSDYGENFDRVIVIPTLGFAIQGDTSELEEDPEEAEGLGVGGAITIGINMRHLDRSKFGPIDTNRLDLFGSIMNYRLKQPFDEVSTTSNIFSLALYGRYRLINDKNYLKHHLLEWGGIHIHTGLQYAKSKIEATQNFKGEVYRSGVLEARFNGGDVDLTLDSYVFTIPVEISTFFRVGYLLTLYTGMSVDFNYGESEIELGANGSISGGVTVLDNDFEAEFDRDASVDGEPSPMSSRAFLGVQFNLPYFRTFVHLNKGIGNDLIGAYGGVKFVF